MGDKMYLYGYGSAYWYTAKCSMICKLFVTQLSTLLIEYQYNLCVYVYGRLQKKLMFRDCNHAVAVYFFVTNYIIASCMNS